MKQLNIQFVVKFFFLYAKKNQEDLLNNEKVDTRNLATSVNADLILKDKRKDKVLNEKDHINIFGPITGG